MTAELTMDGQVTLPKEALENLVPGTQFEVSIDSREKVTITLRQSEEEPESNWVDELFACPHPFEVPERSKELPREVDLS